MSGGTPLGPSFWDIFVLLLWPFPGRRKPATIVYSSPTYDVIRAAYPELETDAAVQAERLTDHGIIALPPFGPLGGSNASSR